MKIRHLIMVSLILAILAIGAVSASQDADDNLTVTDDVKDVIEVPLEEDNLGGSSDAGEFHVRYEESIAVNSNDDAMHVSSKGNVKYDGNLTVKVGDNQTPSYNRALETPVGLKVSDLNITQMGTYRILVSYVANNGNPTKLADYMLNVTESEGHTNISAYILDYNMDEVWTLTSPAFVEILCPSIFRGNFLLYIDGELYFNGTELSTIGMEDLKKRPTLGNHFVRLVYDDGVNQTIIKSRTVLIYSKNANKDKIKLTLKKVKVKRSAKKLVLQATLKINGKAAKSKVIKFKFNKKTYKAKTNKKGVAKVTIKKKILKKLKVGKKVKIQATYGKTTKKLTVKVKR